MPSIVPGPENMLINATRRKKKGRWEGREEVRKGRSRQRGNEEGKEGCEMDWLEKRLLSRTQSPYYSREINVNRILRWQKGKYFKDFSEIEFTKLENWL